MALATIRDGRVLLESEWRERELCRQVPGCIWSDTLRAWTATLSWATCVALRGVFGERLEVGADLSEWAAGELDGWIARCLELRLATEPQREVYGMERLEPLQAVGVDFLATAGRALCGDGMGSGKTIETICAVEELARRGGDDAAYPCLVVCNNSMVYGWAEELEAWAPHRSAAVLKGGAQTRRKLIESGPEWMVINWEALASHTRLAPYGAVALSDKEKEPKELNEAPPATVVGDEAHRAKNPKAKQTRAWWRLSWDARNSLAATGTPTDKTPESLWSIMHGVSREDFPAKTTFVDRYCTKAWGYFGGLEVNGLRGDTRDELYRFLDPRFIRRPTQAVCPDIAEKLSPQVRLVDMPPKQRRAYESMRKEMLAELDGGVLLAADPVSRLLRLHQLASAYGEVTEETVDERGRVRQTFVMADPSCKVDALVDLVDELDEDPIVVFARNRQLIEVASARLEKAGVEHGLLTGAVTPLERARYVNRFQDGELRAMLCTLGAGAESVTLTRARHVAFLQRGSLLQNKQAEDRVWRRGQDRPVQPILVVSRGTVEEHVLESGREAEEAFEEVVRDEATLRALLSARV